jgi:hypothetical protein
MRSDMAVFVGTGMGLDSHHAHRTGNSMTTLISRPALKSALSEKRLELMASFIAPFALSLLAQQAVSRPPGCRLRP